jgi:inorganic pyrophosphatase
LTVDFRAWRPHPWHGLEVGPDPPRTVTAYIEITPFDLVKYEVDKTTGYLRVERPQLTSSSPPVLYGFIPRTYCGDRVAHLYPEASGGDGDPMDICVLSERPIERADILLTARVVGGLRMIDHGEADDKIVAVLKDDPIWSSVREMDDLPVTLMDRLIHYFETYKLTPGAPPTTAIRERYDAVHAFAVVEASMEDYQERFEPVEKGDK